jgi:hypothetical protein
MSSDTGGLSVSLASLDGRIFGGRVAGPLTAASPVQVTQFYFVQKKGNRVLLDEHALNSQIMVFTPYMLIDSVLLGSCSVC